MASKTLQNILDFVRAKNDLQEELFISPSELVSYVEEAIKFCEAEVHKLNIEDMYFVAQAPIAITSGQQDYALPSDIYANKILRLLYARGSEVYSIKRTTSRRRFEVSEAMLQDGGSASPWSWEYMLVNKDPSLGSRIRLYPDPQETSTVVTATGDFTAGSNVITNVSTTAGVAKGFFVAGTPVYKGVKVLSTTTTTITMDEVAKSTATGAAITLTEPRVLCWYIRRAQIPVALTDPIDFPEFWNFIAQHVLVECLKKELGNPRYAPEKMKLDELREQTISTLSNMVPDQDDKLELDTEIYQDMDIGVM